MIKVGDYVECIYSHINRKDFVKGEIYKVYGTKGDMNDFRKTNEKSDHSESFIYIETLGGVSIIGGIYLWRFKDATKQMRKQKLERILNGEV